MVLTHTMAHMTMSYANREDNWQVYLGDSQETLDQWFISNGKGVMKYNLILDGYGRWAPKQVEIGFSDPATAVMLKLAWGGR